MEVLTAAAQLALRAPSAFNTQPWRWLVRTGSLELHADRDRHLGAVDPEDRLIAMSCGAALHHARIALAAAGHDAHVCRWPEPGQPDLLARIRLAGPHRPSAGEVDLAHAITTRRTDRHASLLIVGDRGGGAITRAVLGSVTRGVIGLATGPVAVTHIHDAPPARPGWPAGQALRASRPGRIGTNDPAAGGPAALTGRHHHQVE